MKAMLGARHLKSKMTSLAASAALGLGCAAVMSLAATPAHAETLCGWTVTGAIGAYIKANYSWLGCPINNESYVSPGWYQDTARGYTVFYSNATGIHWSHGAIGNNIKNNLSRYGYPTRGMISAGAGWYQNTANGYTVFYSDATGLHWSHGAIGSNIRANLSWYGYPTNNIHDWNQPGGYAQDTYNGFTVVWSGDTGLHYLYGPVRSCILKYADQNAGWLGFPNTNPTQLSPHAWRQNTTKHVIYWFSSIGCSFD